MFGNKLPLLTAYLTGLCLALQRRARARSARSSASRPLPATFPGQTPFPSFWWPAAARRSPFWTATTQPLRFPATTSHTLPLLTVARASAGTHSPRAGPPTTGRARLHATTAPRRVEALGWTPPTWLPSLAWGNAVSTCQLQRHILSCSVSLAGMLRFAHPLPGRCHRPSSLLITEQTPYDTAWTDLDVPLASLPAEYPGAPCLYSPPNVPPTPLPPIAPPPSPPTYPTPNAPPAYPASPPSPPPRRPSDPPSPPPSPPEFPPPDADAPTSPPPPAGPPSGPKSYRCKPDIALWGTFLPGFPVKLNPTKTTEQNTATCQARCDANAGCKGYYYKVGAGLRETCT